MTAGEVKSLSCKIMWGISGRLAGILGDTTICGYDEQRLKRITFGKERSPVSYDWREWYSDGDYYANVEYVLTRQDTLILIILAELKLDYIPTYVVYHHQVWMLRSERRLVMIEWVFLCLQNIVPIYI